MTKERLTKEEEYSLKILSALNTLFDKDSDCFIGEDELNTDPDNLTHFFHALMNIAPGVVYNELTGGKLNQLELNHLANKLAFQYSKPITKK